MRKKKIECENGWIVFLVEGFHVIQVHSTGKIFEGVDDRGDLTDNTILLDLLKQDAINNDLHSQQNHRGGVRWPEVLAEPTEPEDRFVVTIPQQILKNGEKGPRIKISVEYEK